jgi:CheY-like chemotaxis protein
MLFFVYRTTLITRLGLSGFEKQVAMTKVLIAEDDVLIADMLSDVVTEAGFEVCGVAATTAEAIALGEHHRPELALIDVQLAGGDDGMEIAEHLLQIMKIGILYTTGNCQQVMEKRPQGVGCLAKPFALQDAISALKIVDEIVTTGLAPPSLPAQLRLLGR